MSQISAATNLDNAVRPQTNRFSEMSSDDFVKIIFTELTHQDPLEPTDTGALLEQLNSIRSIESDLKITRQLEALVSENQLASASNMLGKLVQGRTEDLSPVEGRVIAAVKEGDTVSLQLEGGWRVPLSNVEAVVEAVTSVPQTVPGLPL